MRKLSHIQESVWGDIRKRADGTVVKKEDQDMMDRINDFVQRHNLKKDRYHVNADFSVDIIGNISIVKDDLIDGKLPFKFKKIEGTMYLTNNLQLETLENAPREVTGDFVIYQNKFKDFIGGPEIVGGDFAANFNRRLESLDGSPKKVGGNYSIVFCTSINDIRGISPEIGGNLEITDDVKWEVRHNYTDEEYRKYSNIKGNIIRRK